MEGRAGGGVRAMEFEFVEPVALDGAEAGTLDDVEAV